MDIFQKCVSKNLFLLFTFYFLLFSGCSWHSFDPSNITQRNKKDFSKRFQKPKVVGKIKSKEITESSGIVASRCNEGVFWTHNDSRNGAFIYAINKKGEKLGTWKVKNAENKDWEDIAIDKNDKGECFLYIGDIGNNTRSRGEFGIYVVKEPKVSASNKSSNEKKPILTDRASFIKFTYPELRRDAETLLIHPKTKDLYIVSKRLSGASGVYKLSAKHQNKKVNKLKKIGDVSVPALPNGLLTGGEISSDGKRIILCDYFNAYEITLPKKAKNFDEIWKIEPSIIELGKRQQGEAICYSVDMKSIFATSEKKNSPVIEVKRMNK